MILLSQAKKDILAESKEDYVGLWSIISRVKRSGLETAKIYTATLNLLREMLDDGEIVAGNFHQIDPRKYDLSTDEIIQLIEQDWKKLGREPTLGESVSFTAPSFLANIIG